MEPAALGFRVKSGWAAAVVLAGPATKPRVVKSQRVELADPAIPDSRQPYHAALDLPAEEGAEVVRRLRDCVESSASRSVSKLLTHYRDGDYRILGVGIIVGSDVDPETIKNDHIRAHAAEGRLFREVIEKAAGKSGLKSVVTVEKRLLSEASRVLRMPEGRLKSEVTALGRGAGGHWRAEQKAATFAAWMVLASAEGESSV